MEYEETNTTIERPQRRHRQPSNRIFIVRNVLNLLFMVGAIVGVVYTLKVDRIVGAYIICGSMVFKFIDSALRILKL